MYLKTKNLSYSVGSQQILQNISFQMSAGEFAGLMGPNGSGKTTLIRILSGVIENYSGEVFLDGVSLKNLPKKEIAQSIAVVPQEAHFAFPFSALEVVLMGRHPYQKDFSFDSETDLALAREAMAATDSLQFAHRNIDTLSGGEKQRVLLARALCQKPRFLLLDEPASHLDLAHLQGLYALLRRLNDDAGIGILCVAHDLNLAASHCRRVILLKEGKKNSDGEMEEVLNEDNIHQVFGVSCGMIKNNEGKNFFIIR